MAYKITITEDGKPTNEKSYNSVKAAQKFLSKILTPVEIAQGLPEKLLAFSNKCDVNRAYAGTRIVKTWRTVD